MKKPGRKKMWTAEKIKSLRQSFGESREEFAQRLASSKFSLRNWEQGQVVPSDRICMLLDMLEEERRNARAEKQTVPA